MGRLSKESIIDAIKASNGRVGDAARRLGCTSSAIYKRIRAESDLEEVVQEAREEIIDLAESQLLKLIKRGNITAIIFLLKTLGRSRGYAERIEVERSGGMDVRLGGIKPEQLVERVRKWAETHCKPSSNGSSRKNSNG